MRIHLVLVGDGVAQRFIQVRCLETERLEVEGRTAVLSSSSFEGLDEVAFRYLDGDMKPLPKVALTSALAPPTTHSAANYTASLRAREA